MTAVPYSHIQKGTYLIASPDLDSGFFIRSVLLICEHNPVGSFGLVVNKPLDIELPDEIINQQTQENRRISIRTGGPVHTHQMMLLHDSPNIATQSLEICSGVYLGGDLNFLHEAASQTEGPFIHLCFGYAAWGAGQLEREFLDGQWFICPASHDSLFQVPPTRLWQTLLREMGGKYASLSMIPEDLSLN